MNVPPGAHDQFLADGYAVVEDAIAPADLRMLDARCADHLARQLADMERVGAERLGLTHKDRRYFLSTWDSCTHMGSGRKNEKFDRGNGSHGRILHSSDLTPIVTPIV